MSNLNIQRSYQTLLTLWFALLASQAMFLIVIFFAKPELFKFDGNRLLLGDNAAIVIGFAFLALTNLALSFVMKKRSFQQAEEKQDTTYVQTGLIIACAFCETISLLGVVLALAFSYQYFFVWIGLGIVGIVLHFPTREALIAASYKG